MTNTGPKDFFNPSYRSQHVCPSRSFAALGISRQNVSENSLAPLPINRFELRQP